MAYEIIFYENEKGHSEIWDFLEKLRVKSATSKDARIQYNQTILYIELLKNNGTMLPNNITKCIEENIWELRPGSNRIFYFYHDNNAFVLLHSFRKKLKKLHAGKLTKQNPSVTTTYLEGRIDFNEKLERL